MLDGEGLWTLRGDPRRNVHDLPSRARRSELDQVIARLAYRQHGVVALRQLVEAGLSGSGVRDRVARGRLHRLHRGVYAVGHARVTRTGRFLAAALACGPDAVVSHRCAGWLLDLRTRLSVGVDVTAPRAAGRRRPGIRVHSGATLTAADVTVVDGVPCTSVPRALLDIAETATTREVERLLDRAEQLRMLDMRAVDDVLARAGGRRGAASLRAVLAGHRAGSTLTRNDLEEAFLEICRGAGHPPDGVNVWIAYPDGSGAEADFLWRSARLIAEVDGRDVHATRHAFEHDRRRDQRLMMLGWRVARFTRRQVLEEPAAAAAALVALLGGATTT